MKNVVPEKGSNLQLLSTERRTSSVPETAALREDRKDRIPFRLDAQVVPTTSNGTMMRSEARSLYARFIIRWSQEKLANHGVQEAA